MEQGGNYPDTKTNSPYYYNTFYIYNKMQIQHNISLLPHNTFGIDVTANTIASYNSEEDLANAVKTCFHALAKPLLHIGEGSNLLFTKDFPGTVLLSKIVYVEKLSQSVRQVIVRAGSGMNMDDFIAHAISKGWYGLENLSKIPGQVGASAVQNIGAYGVEVGNCIHAVNCISLSDGSNKTFTHDECEFSYRHSIFKSPEYKGRYAITSVDYCLNMDFNPNLDYAGIRQQISSAGIDAQHISAKELREIIIQIRDSKLPDPKVLGNAGSFFMNPIVDRSTFERLTTTYPNIPKYELSDNLVKIPAAWLIEQSGWKGRPHGRAAVHHIQPLVLVNTGGATGNEICELSDMVRDSVFAKFGISIKPEVNFI